MKKAALFIINFGHLLVKELTDRFYFVIDIFRNSPTKQPLIMSKEETVKYALENRCGLCRFGDGEIKLISGKDLYFQEASEELSAKLSDALKADHEKLLVCIPDVFSSLGHFEAEDALYWKKHLSRFRPVWYGQLKAGRLYGNAFISRPYICFREKEKAGSYFDLIKRLWAGEKLVIIEGEKSRLGVGNDLFDGATEIRRILGPSSQAYSRYKELLEAAKKVDKSFLLVTALGPVGSLLAHDLTASGYRVLDLGNLDTEYEWYLRGCKQKQPIENKLVYEALTADDIGPCSDENYKSQIIAEIF